MILRMRRAVLVLAMLVAVGCGEAPPEGARPLTNGAATAQAILDHWHVSTPVPPLYGVPTNCTTANGGPGFRKESGGCVSGRTIVDWQNDVTGIYLVVYPGARYHRELPHELIHAVHELDHKREDLWAVHDPILSLEALTSMWLASQPELDLTPSVE